MPIPTSATITNGGLNLLAAALINASANAAISFVAIGTGLGTLAPAGGLTSGNAYTSLTLTAGIPGPLSAGQSISLLYQTNYQTVTLSASVLAGVTTLPVTSFTANFSYPGSTTGLTTTPGVTDTLLNAEALRNAVTANNTGLAAGETLSSMYISPAQGAGLIYTEIGWFGGATADAGANDGTLVARGLFYYAHTTSDSMMTQLDSIV